MRVLCTGLREKTTECQDLISDLGGILVTKVTQETKPEVVVAQDVTTEKYKVVAATCKTPAVTIDWLYACKTAKRKVPFDGHRVPPFQGLKVCTTGFTPPDCAALQDMTQRGGGEFCRDFTRDCSHLLCAAPCDPKSAKYTMALKWRIPVVSKQWLIDSAEAGARQDESCYTLSPHAKAQRNFPGPAPTNVAREAEPTNAVQRPLPAPPAETSRAAGGGGPSAGDAGRREDGGGISAVACTGPLDGIRVVLLGCLPSEQAEQARLVREGGAIREPRLSSRTTHAVVGSDRSCASLASLRSHAGRYSEHTAIVSLSWLRDCLDQRCRLEPAGSHLVPLAQLGASNGRRQAPLAQNGDSNDASATTQSRSLSQGVSKPPTSRPAGRPERVFGLYQGLVFTLDALEGLPDLWAAARARLEHGGGTILGHSADSAPERTYAVCPFGFAGKLRERAMASKAFKSVERKRWVTVHWLEFTEQAGKLFPPSTSLIFQPIEHEVPMPWMDGIRISVSGYDETQRMVIKALTKQLGGKYSDSFGKRNTHLVLPEATGAKYSAAVKLQRSTVTCDWILASAAKGRRMPESKFPPKPCAAPAGGDAGPDVPSQVYTTQNPATNLAAAFAAQSGDAKRPSVRAPGLFSFTQADAAQPEFLNRLMESHKVSESQVMPSANWNGSAACAPVSKPATRAPGGTALMDYMHNLLDDGDAGAAECEGGGADAVKDKDTTESARNAEGNHSDGDEEDDLLKKVNQLVDNFGGAVQSANTQGDSESPAAKGGKARRPKRPLDPMSIAGRSRSTRRIRPSNEDSNQESDFLASQVEHDMQVVYQQEEKTASVLKRCSKRPKDAQTVSAKEFLNRAVSSGPKRRIEPDELKEMGLL